MPRPATGRKLFTFRLDPAHRERLDAIASEETRRMGCDVPLSLVVRSCLARGIEAREHELGLASAAGRAPTKRGKRRAH